MRASRSTYACVLTLLFVGMFAARSAYATAAGPQPGTTGVPSGGGFPAEQSCIACHASQPMNPDKEGAIALRGVPERYTPGERYTLTFSISHPGSERMRWGFQLTAIAAESFRGAGHFVVTDPRNTQMLAFGEHGREYIEHTFPGTGIGIVGGYEWSFDWVAPDTNVGAVAFYGGGNASNTDGSKEGDLIFSPAPKPMAMAAGESANADNLEETHGDS